MAAYFFDTSALVKYYHTELGSDRVNAIFAEPGRVVRISSLGVLETQSVFAMKGRSGELDRDVAGLFRASLMLDIARACYPYHPRALSPARVTTR